MQKYKMCPDCSISLRARVSTVILLFVTPMIILAQTREPADWQVITTRRPLVEAANLLENRYLKPITYEDPIWAWSGDVEPIAVARGLYPKEMTFTLPIDLNASQLPVLDASLLNKVLDAYHRQTDGPRFEIATSTWGLHILPAQVRDTSGQLVRATRLLDTVISVPEEKRTPSEHFQSICAAVTASNSSGMKLLPADPWLDWYFAPNGIRPPKRMTVKDEEQISFPWGAADVSARAAIISLLENSSTTLTWRVMCQAGEGECMFQLVPIMLTSIGPDGKQIRKPLTYDRCIKCPSK